jgi:glycosyltransferase involved in cell wall biosynthesis
VRAVNLSIIVPTFNGSAYLGAALESIWRQIDTGVEVIVVDDGSTDSTIAVAEAYAERLPLTLLRRPHLGNWIARINLGMTAARGDYLCWLHQDDVWLEGRWKILKRFIARGQTSGLLVHSAWFIDQQGERCGVWTCPFGSKCRVISSDEFLARLVVQNFLAASTPVFHARLLDNVGLPDERLWYLGDWEFWLRLAAAGPVAYDPRPLVGFRLHRDSQTTQTLDQTDEIALQFDEVLNRQQANGWIAPVEDLTRRTAGFSARLNVALAQALAGRRLAPVKLIHQFTALGPKGWSKYFRDSRLHERCAGRIRAGLIRCRRGPVENKLPATVDGSPPVVP